MKKLTPLPPAAKNGLAIFQIALTGVQKLVRYLRLRYRIAKFERELAYFQIDGNELEAFVFTSTIYTCHLNLMNLCQRRKLPIVSFEEFQNMVLTRKTIRFTQGNQWVSLVMYFLK